MELELAYDLKYDSRLPKRAFPAMPSGARVGYGGHRGSTGWSAVQGLGGRARSIFNAESMIFML